MQINDLSPHQDIMLNMFHPFLTNYQKVIFFAKRYLWFGKPFNESFFVVLGDNSLALSHAAKSLGSWLIN